MLDEDEQAGVVDNDDDERLCDFVGQALDGYVDEHQDGDDHKGEAEVVVSTVTSCPPAETTSRSTPYSYSVYDCHPDHHSYNNTHDSCMEESPLQFPKPRKKRMIRAAFIAMVVLLLVVLITTAVLLTQRTSSSDAPSQRSDPPPPASRVSQNNRVGCNGSPNLCDMRVNEMLFATLHTAIVSNSSENNSSNNNTTNTIIPPEDIYVRALESGYRGFHFNLGKCNGELALLDDDNIKSCSAESLDPVQVLTRIVQFTKENPEQVIVLTTQIVSSNETEALTVRDIMLLFVLVPGLTDLLYAHAVNDVGPWPKLQTLIDANQRILFFQYTSAGNNAELCGVDTTALCPPGVHSYVDYVAATPSDFDTVASLQNTRASFAIAQGGGGAGDFFAMNAFTRDDSCAEVNEAAFLMSRLTLCGSPPNLLLTDCWNVGDVLEVVKDYNEGLVAPTYQAATLPIIFWGATGTMGTTTIGSFSRHCSRYFSNRLDASNVECEVLSQQIGDSSRLLQAQQQEKNEIEIPSHLEVMVQVTGDVPAGKPLFDSKQLTVAVGNGEAMRKNLRNAGSFFKPVFSILEANADVPPVPTDSPTQAPTISPSQVPSKMPSLTPTAEPTQSPTRAPTRAPTSFPTKRPTSAPTGQPTRFRVTATPTSAPTSPPTRSPVSAAPTRMPMRLPTTAHPTVAEVPSTAAPSPHPPRDISAVEEAIDASVPADKFTPGPYNKALLWILNRDPMQLRDDSNKLIQRFLAAYVYYATSRNGDWSTCAEPLDDDTTCIYERVTSIDPFQTNDVIGTRWLSSVSECSWIGVTCNKDGNIQSLELGNLGLSGWFPGGVAFLPHLEKLSLSFGELTGGMSQFPFAGLHQLTHLDLGHSKFDGQLPESLQFLTSIKHLDLSANSITGSLPFTALGSLTALTSLSLSGNRLMETVPASFYNLKSLERLDLSSNQLSGTIASDISAMSNLVSIDISSNLFGGQLPTELGLLKNLKSAMFSDNYLSGMVPTELCPAQAWEGLVIEADCKAGSLSGYQQIICHCCNTCCDWTGCLEQ